MKLPDEQNEKRSAGRPMRCSEAAPLLCFYSCEELDPRERELVSAHVAECAACAEQLRAERALLDSLAALPQPADRLDPADALLAQCRSELSESLDDLASPPRELRWQPLGWFKQLMVFHPAWSAFALILLGVFAGSQFFAGEHSAQGQGQVVRATPRLTEEQLSRMAIAGINFAPSSGSAPGTVQVQLRAEQPLVLSGSTDDTDVRHVLTYVVANGRRFDDGLRLDCLDALKSVTRDTDVREALLSAARRDGNPAVRLKALEALRATAGDEDVRGLLIDTLENDDNPGVRVEAVNLLVGSLPPQADLLRVTASPQPPRAVSPRQRSHRPNGRVVPEEVPVDPSVERVLRALEELTRKDPNRYVRLRSQAALHEIASHEMQ